MGETPLTHGQQRHFLLRLWDSIVVQPLRDIDEEARAFQNSQQSGLVDRKTIVVMITTCVVLTMQAYLSGGEALDYLVRSLRTLGFAGAADGIESAMYDRENAQLAVLLAWCGLRAIEWLVIPAIIIRLVFRERVADYGMKLRGAIDGWWLYLVMLAVVLPLVFYVSSGHSFLKTYPYYQLDEDESLWPRFWCWEAAYFAQFFCLEFYFRGFMVHGTRHRFGWYSIFVMTVPYCMIHFGKPMPETLGSIVAGVVLGFMSLKTRSIWLGTALHITVAGTMDMLALSHGGRFR